MDDLKRIKTRVRHPQLLNHVERIMKDGKERTAAEVSNKLEKDSTSPWTMGLGANRISRYLVMHPQIKVIHNGNRKNAYRHRGAE